MSYLDESVRFNMEGVHKNYESVRLKKFDVLKTPKGTLVKIGRRMVHD